MIDAHDFNTSLFLDDLAARYNAMGYRVDFQPFVYNADSLAQAVASTLDVRVTIEHDADFVMCQLTGSVHNAGASAVRPRPVVAVELILDSAQRRLQANPILLHNWFGDGGRPHFLYKPLVLAAKTSFTVRLTNNESATRDIRLAFIGVKAYLEGCE